MIKTAIFDLDGTLLDTLEDLYLSVNAALKQYGFPEKSLSEVKSYVGNGVRRLMQLAVPDGESNPQFEDCLLTFKEHYKVHMNDHTGPYPGIMELLEKIQSKGGRMAIVSNKFDAAVKTLNQKFFGEYIETAIGESEQVRRKPEPDTVYAAIRELNEKPENCVYVGDSEVDILTAANSGLACIAVTWGFRTKEFLKENGADCLIDKPEELLGRIME